MSKDAKVIAVVIAALSLSVAACGGILGGGATITPANAPAAARKNDLDEKTVQAIITHKWWPKSPTRAKTEEMVKFVSETESGQCAWIDDHFHMARAADGDPAPPGIGSRRIDAFIDPKTVFKHMPRSDAIIWIKVCIDSAMKKDGPARD